MRIYALLVVFVGLTALPIAWLIYPIAPGVLGELGFLAVGTQVAALMPIQWTHGRQYVFLPLLLAAGLVAPGAGVGLVAWLCVFDGRVPGRDTTWWGMPFNRAILAITYVFPSLMLAFLPHLGLIELPVKTILFTVAILLLNYPLTARAISYMNNISMMHALVENIGLSTLRSMFVLGLVGGILFELLEKPIGYLMAPGLFGLLLAVRANLSDVRRQAEARKQTLRLAAQALDARDAYTESHSERVADLAGRLGEVLDLSPRELDQLREAGTLHDLGKIGIPDHILNNPHRLTDEEWVEMKRHPDIGADMIAKHSALASIASMVRHHHERWDGSGYPAGLVGHQIPLGARIISVADSFDTITTPRIYRASTLPPPVAVADISARAGKWYDPLVVDALRSLHNLPRLHAIEDTDPRPFQGLAAIQLLKTRPRFAQLMLGMTISSLGDPLTVVASMIAIYAATRQPLAVAASFGVQALATILMSGTLGGLSDRVPRQRVVLILDLARAGLLFVTPLLLHLSVWLIFPNLFLLAAANSLVQPARQAAIPELVGQGEVGRATATVAMFGMLALAVGYPLAAGIIWAAGSTNALFVADGITFAVAGLLILGLGSLGGGATQVGLTSALRRAWAVAPARLHLLTAAAGAFFFSMSFPALIVLAYQLATRQVHGPQAYTLLQSSLGLGVVGGSIIVGRRRNIGTMRTVTIGLAISGVLCFGIAASTVLWASAMLLLAASIGNPIYTVGNQTALLELGTSNNRGSLMTSRFGITQTAIIAGAGVGGLTTKLVGPQFTYGFLGLGLLVVALLTIAVVQRERSRQTGSFAEPMHVGDAAATAPVQTRSAG